MGPLCWLTNIQVKILQIIFTDCRNFCVAFLFQMRYLFEIFFQFSGSLMEATRFIRDTYSFKRDFTAPVMKLEKMDPMKSYMQRQKQVGTVINQEPFKSYIQRNRQVSTVNVQESCKGYTQWQRRMISMQIQFVQVPFPPISSQPTSCTFRCISAWLLGWLFGCFQHSYFHRFSSKTLGVR